MTHEGELGHETLFGEVCGSTAVLADLFLDGGDRTRETAACVTILLECRTSALAELLLKSLDQIASLEYFIDIGIWGDCF